MHTKLSGYHAVTTPPGNRQVTVAFLPAVTYTDAEKAEYDDVVRQLMQKCEQLAAENTRLHAEKSDALSVCQELYSDPTAPAALRLKAAGLALPHEVPRLEPVPAAIDSTCEEIIPLADLLARRRARQKAVENLPPGDPRWAEWVDRDRG